MSEWKLTPDYIVNNWTDELLELMVVSLGKRKKREFESVQGNASALHNANSRTVSDVELFRMAGGKIRVTKTG